MSQIKKIFLYLIGIVLLIFGNREVLAKITNKPVDVDEKELKADSIKSYIKKKDSLRREAIHIVERKNNAIDSVKTKSSNTTLTTQEEQTSTTKKTEKKKKSHVVVKGADQEAEKATQTSTTTTTSVEKEEPEKAHGTE